jgi:hypothetical protein
MKNVFSVTCAFAIGLLLLTSCEKEETKKETPTPLTPVGKGFTCKIDGVQFTADSSRVNFYSGGATVIAYKGGTTAIEINTIVPIVSNKPFSARRMLTYIDGTSFFLSSTGNLDVTAADSASANATGTFNCIAVNANDSMQVKVITEGSFSN